MMKATLTLEMDLSDLGKFLSNTAFQDMVLSGAKIVQGKPLAYSVPVARILSFDGPYDDGEAVKVVKGAGDKANMEKRS